ncbi:hypothetical protein V5O48_013814 [Marasmius crinis-equi]|uniref:F-box domain-containing protein n=1 Tax=Marasmius crinis-equi TaxID=585013 RepID=A0ABR3EZ13_9AGAR
MSSILPPSTSLPIELVEEIISALWVSPLTVSERLQFIDSSADVSDLWNAIFLRVASTDFYIIAPFHAFLLLCMLRGDMDIPVNSKPNLIFPLNLCRSITFQDANDHLIPSPTHELKCAIGLLFKEILRYLSPQQFPSLRRLSLELKNCHMLHVFEEDTLFSRFPRQVTELEINFTYGEDTKSEILKALKGCTCKTFRLESAKSAELKKLTVLGATSGVTKEILDAFGGLEKLQSFKQDAWEEDEEGDEEFFDAETGLEPRGFDSPSNMSLLQEKQETPHKVRQREALEEGNCWTPTGYSNTPFTRKRGLGEKITQALRRWTRRGH